MVTCAHCGASQRAGDRFCGDCGSRLGGCPSCGEPALPGKRFCHACGTALLSAEPAAASPAASAVTISGPVSERRVCSVLFADLVGFTSLFGIPGPRRGAGVLSHYFQVPPELISRYAGVVEKFIGDAVMAVRGIRLPQRVTRSGRSAAALEVVDAVEPLGTEIGLGAASRAGMVTGEVAVTIGAGGEGIRRGCGQHRRPRPGCRRAGRSSSTTRPRGCLECHRLRRCRRAPLKGDAEPAPSPATGVCPSIGGEQRVDRLEAPSPGVTPSCEGRGPIPRRRTAGCPASLSSRARGVGEPGGLGVREVHGSPRRDRVWHRGRCLSYGEGIALGASRDRPPAVGIAEEEPTEGRGEAQKGILASSKTTERAYLGARLARFLGCPRLKHQGGAGPTGALCRVAVVLRAPGGGPPRDHPRSKMRSTPTAACSGLRPPGRLGPRPADLRPGLPPGPGSNSPRPGTARAGTAPPVSRPARTPPRWPAWSTHWSPAAAVARSAISARARASPCSRSRHCDR